MLVGVAAALAQGGFYLATKAVKPKLSASSTRSRAPSGSSARRRSWEGAKMLIKSAVVGARLRTPRSAR